MIFLMKLTLNENSFVFDREIVSLLLEIEEFKGQWKAYGNLAPERLSALKYIAAIESIGSSTRIEGSLLTDADVSRVVKLPVQTLKTLDEQEVAGYARLINRIFGSWKTMPLTEEIIQEMHVALMLPDKDEMHRGAYKTVDNQVAAFDAQGRHIGVLLETAGACETPFFMQELVGWTNTLLEERRLPSLVVIGMFIVAFLAIHPFADGNGRLSRALITLLMLRCGYGYAEYSSLERIFEETRQSYYIALRTSQKTLGKFEPDWNFWMLYFLQSLAKQVRNLKIKLEREVLMHKLPDQSRRIFELIQSRGPVSIQEAASALDANLYTLRSQFKKLTERGDLEPIGCGRATKYGLKCMV